MNMVITTATKILITNLMKNPIMEMATTATQILITNLMKNPIMETAVESSPIMTMMKLMVVLLMIMMRKTKSCSQHSKS